MIHKQLSNPAKASAVLHSSLRRIAIDKASCLTLHSIDPFPRSQDILRHDGRLCTWGQPVSSIDNEGYQSMSSIGIATVREERTGIRKEGEGNCIWGGSRETWLEEMWKA